MKIEGLGSQRQELISQICHLVTEVKDFSKDDFKRMADGYAKEDNTISEVLSHATDLADSNYSRFLNAKIVGVPYKFAHLDKGFCQIADNETVIGKAMSELRGRMSDVDEYRKQFLGPAIRETAQLFDHSLRKVQEQEMKTQREEQRARFRAGRVKSYGIEL